MAEYKVACPQCGQHVSGDESFLGITVQCPICMTQFQFPADLAPSNPTPAPPEAPPPAPPGNAPAMGAGDPGQYFNVPTAPSGRAPSPDVVRMSLLAKIAEALGVFAALVSFCTFGLLGPLAILFGLLALLFISKSKGALIGKVKAVTGIGLGVISIVLGVVFYQKQEASRTPINLAFSQAESTISSASGSGRIGFGNSNEAREIATAFATRMKQVREVAIEGNDSAISISNNQFLTFCQLNEDSAAFLVRVPGLRNYTEEAKKFIAEASWSVAQDLLVESSLPDGSQLGVGTRGILSYDLILIGNHLKSFHDEDSEETGIKIEEGEEADLSWFFPDIQIGTGSGE
ncbi:MAG: DUF4190 domain-containing protein [Verrucomicrobiota bacterium]